MGRGYVFRGYGEVWLLSGGMSNEIWTQSGLSTPPKVLMFPGNVKKTSDINGFGLPNSNIRFLTHEAVI